MGRSLGTSELKALYAKSGNVCAFPCCDARLIESIDDESINLGEAAHIVAFSPKGPRGAPHSAQIANRASNHLLLCERHHKIVDRKPGTYTADVLTEMKAAHERELECFKKEKSMPVPVRLESETVPSSLIRFWHMPRRIFGAPLLDRSIRESDVAKLIDYRSLGRDDLVAYVVRENFLYSFNRIKESGAFKQVVDSGAEEVLLVEDLLRDPEWHRRFVRLLNLGVSKHLRFFNIRYDREHDRHYFASDIEVPRAIEYRTTSGRRSTRSVVWNPKTKATGERKNHWWHLAASFHFECFGEFWCLSIRPERHLTTNGVDPLPAKLIGRKVTSLKARLYNDKYLDELVFWRDVLANGKPEILLPFGNQACRGEAKLVEVATLWPPIGDTARRYQPQPREHDLFSLADVEEATGDFDGMG